MENLGTHAIDYCDYVWTGLPLLMSFLKQKYSVSSRANFRLIAPRYHIRCRKRFPVHSSKRRYQRAQTEALGLGTMLGFT